MKPNNWVLAICILITMFSSKDLIGQEKELKYGKTPDKFFPYNNFQEAYKYYEEASFVEGVVQEHK